MIKDRFQKKLAARYCAALGMIPFVEVKIVSHTGLEDSDVDITDIDVLGVELAQGHSPRRVLFDCKTAAKQSGINRALWAAGLKALVSADQAFIIQKRDSPDSHKLVANTLGIQLHSEETFPRYAEAISPRFSRPFTYLDEMDTWDSFAKLGSQSPAIFDLLQQVNIHSPLENNPARGLRSALSVLIRCGGELDPARPLHKAIFSLFVSSLLIHLAAAVSELKEIFQFSMPKETFEQRLRYYVWDGRENYSQRRQLRAALERARGGEVTAPLDLPEWPRFVELVRSFLDSPNALLGLPLLSKELAFREASKPNSATDDHVRLAFSSGRARQYLFQTAGYVASAGRLPRQFLIEFEATINQLLASRGQQEVQPTLL